MSAKERKNLENSPNVLNTELEEKFLQIEDFSKNFHGLIHRFNHYLGKQKKAGTQKGAGSHNYARTA